MRRVLTYGTFDLFHVGHIRLLERARALGDYMVVGVSTDDFNLSKGKRSVFSYEERARIVAALRYVDEVIPEKNWDQKQQDIINFKIDVFVMGSDWEGKFDALSKYCSVVYIPRTEGVSTTYIKNLLKGA